MLLSGTTNKTIQLKNRLIQGSFYYDLISNNKRHFNVIEHRIKNGKKLFNARYQKNDVSEKIGRKRLVIHFTNTSINKMQRKQKMGENINIYTSINKMQRKNGREY